MAQSMSKYPYRLNQWRDYVAREAWDIQAKRVAEVGVFKGATSWRLWRLSHVELAYCIDPWSFAANDIVYKGVSHMGSFEGKPTVDSNQAQLDEIYAKFVRTSSPKSKILRMTSFDAAQYFEDGYFDFIFLDAIHFYEYAKEDIQLWLPKVRPGGILAGDDYGLVKFNEIDGGVQRAVDEAFGDRVYFPMQLKDRVKKKVWCVKV